MKIPVKRVLSLLLVFMLLFGMMPTAMAASADDTGETEPPTSEGVDSDLPAPVEGTVYNDPNNPYPYGFPVTEYVPEDVLEYINSGISGFAMLAADNQGSIPDEMWDNSILRALEYTGYDVQKQKDNGQLYQYKYIGSRLLTNDPDTLSNIGYWDSGSCPNGDETVDDPTTVSGKAPKISYFESNGLVCASFVCYYLCNYLPNIEGVDTTHIHEAVKATTMNNGSYSTASVWAWETGLKNLSNQAGSGVTRYTDESTAYDNMVPGDVVVFAKSDGSLAHVGIYAGEYNLYNGSSNLGTYHFMIHVGNSRGPEISIVEWMSTSSGDKASSPVSFYHLDINDIQETGHIEVNKADPSGNALAGAYFTATNTETQTPYIIGPTDSTGYAISPELPLGTYTVVESVFPEGYQASGETSWTVTLTTSTPNMTITIDAVNEKITSGLSLKKTTEDGKNLAGWKFGVYADATCTNLISGPHTTDASGKISVTGLTPQTVYVKELGHMDSAINALYACSSTNPQKVELVANQTATVSFYNKLNLGNVKLIKTTNTGNNLGGWSIGLYTDAACQNPVSGSPFTTAGDGTVTVSGLKPGTYYAKELPGGDGYWVCDTAVKTVTVVANQTASVTFTNTHYGRIAVQKHTNTGNHLGGWVFTIRDSNGNVAAELTTDENGYAVTGNLPLGKYTIQEKFIEDDYWQVELGFHDVTVKAGETVVDEWTNIEQGLGWFYKETNTAASNEGWEITIYTDEACTQEYRTVVTGEGGKIGLYLNPGVYWAKESGDTLGRFNDEYWQIDPSVQRFEIKPHEDTSVTFQNVHLGKVKIIKVMENEGSAEGWLFKVTDSNGNEIEGSPFTTSADGTILTGNLQPGNYTIEELIPEDSLYYCTSQNPQTITVTEGKTVEVTFTNALRPGEISTQKVDVSGDPLAGAKFILEWSEDGTTWNPVFYSDSTLVVKGGCSNPDVVDGTLITPESGIITWGNLYPTLQYRITELEAPEGFQLLNGPAFKGELPVDDLTVTVRVVNSRIFTLPQTGTKSLALMPIGLVLCAAVCMGALFVLRKKKGA